jgi:hypothetical protein
MSAGLCKGVKLEAPQGLSGPMRLVCFGCRKVIASHSGGMGAAEWIRDSQHAQRDHESGRDANRPKDTQTPKLKI